jgi:hypothetical protein
MLSELKFVQGAVAKKDLLPAMTHFRIENGTVRSYNGTLAISSPIALDIACCPRADAMVKAIGSCQEATMISVTPNGRLSIRSGKFRAIVETIQGSTPHVEPEGDHVAFDGAAVLEAFKVLEPFIGTDASRPFTNGVLLDAGSAYATNNTCLVQYWIGAAFPHRVNVPRACIKEVLRVGEPPTHGQLTRDSITFHYTDGRWIRSQLLNTEWPLDLITKLFEPKNEDGTDAAVNPQPLPVDFFTALATVKHMADGASRVYMMDGALRTHTNPDEGAAYELDLPCDGLYNLHMLSLLEGVVSTIDFTRYPEPALFYGDKLRGAIIGMRM